MSPALLVVDAAHLLACCGRSSGVGAAMARNCFDTDRLLKELLGLLLPTEPVERVLWYDAARDPSRLSAPPMHHQPPVTALVLPLRGGKQRNVEAALLRDVMTRLSNGSVTMYLVGDPRRHAVAIQEAQRFGGVVRLVGIADGEPTPAPRIWLRRQQVLRALTHWPTERVPRDRSRHDYQAPTLHATQVRLPRAPTTG